MQDRIRSLVLRGLAAASIAACAQGALAQDSHYYAQAGIEPWLVDSAVPPSAGSYFTGSQGWQPRIDLAVGYDSGALPSGAALRGQVLSQADLGTGTFRSHIHTDYRAGAGVLGAVSLGQYVDTLTFSAGPAATAQTITKVVVTLESDHNVWYDTIGPANTHRSVTLTARSFGAGGTVDHAAARSAVTDCDDFQCFSTVEEPWGPATDPAIVVTSGGSSGPDGDHDTITFSIDLKGTAPVLELGASWLDYMAGIGGDLGRVSRLTIDAPDGVTWTSQSGLLLAGRPADLLVRAVPEPAGWELGLAALAALAWAVRRRA